MVNILQDLSVLYTDQILGQVPAQVVPGCQFGPRLLAAASKGSRGSLPDVGGVGV